MFRSSGRGRVAPLAVAWLKGLAALAGLAASIAVFLLDHIGSLVNSPRVALNSEEIASIPTVLAASVRLALCVPVTTAIAAYFARRGVA